MKRGSVTIEMSFLMPIITAVLVFLIYMGYFMHDKCIITKACLSSAVRGATEFEDKTKAKNLAEAAVEEVLEKHLILNWDYKTDIAVGNEVTVEYEGVCNILSSPINWLLSIDEMDYSYFARAYRSNPSKYIREKRKAGVGY